ncbi:MAG TPA: hypothetical protein H9815_11250 [Candidatus Ruania gallistercoris]|uniref:Uncharacterized protein n=1 Tax=Candidatus Ruania gallistercoris TaxID=2838746 RepID=A0A9D2EFG6_9MICO|nr:hypothetical protein [Candidatus Ruania gallistercoris]
MDPPKKKPDALAALGLALICLSLLAGLIFTPMETFFAIDHTSEASQQTLDEVSLFAGAAFVLGVLCLLAALIRAVVRHYATRRAVRTQNEVQEPGD